MRAAVIAPGHLQEPACCGFLMGEGSGEGHQTLTRDLVTRSYSFPALHNNFASAVHCLEETGPP